jgi:hypothetical protein
MSAPDDIVVAVARAVEAVGGDLDDARHLLAEWERLVADKRGRLDRLRYDTAHPVCACADGGDPGEDGRCGRCSGLIRREAAR